MGWVSRGAKFYYYRSRRIGGRVRTESFSGPIAELEAAADEEARYARRREAERFSEEDEIEDEIEGELDRLFGKLEDFTTERLEAGGFYRHKRQWRRRRNAKA